MKLKVRFMNRPTRKREGKKAEKRLRTIAKARMSDIGSKMSDIPSCLVIGKIMNCTFV